MLDRARAYNADPAKPLFIDKLRVFGSYINPEIDPLGDVDLELSYGRRTTNPQLVADYAKASGRSFNTYVDRLLWPYTELVQHLKQRSAFINITTEDIARLTDYRRPTWPDPSQEKQAHIELGVDDLDAAEARLLALGAVQPEFQPDPDRWRVLLDPAGHPFCVSTLV